MLRVDTEYNYWRAISLSAERNPNCYQHHCQQRHTLYTLHKRFSSDLVLINCAFSASMPLDGQQEEHPAPACKQLSEQMCCWHGYLSSARCK